MSSLPDDPRSRTKYRFRTSYRIDLAVARKYSELGNVELKHGRVLKRISNFKRSNFLWLVMIELSPSLTKSQQTLIRILPCPPFSLSPSLQLRKILILWRPPGLAAQPRRFKTVHFTKRGPVYRRETALERHRERKKIRQRSGFMKKGRQAVAWAAFEIWSMRRTTDTQALSRIHHGLNLAREWTLVFVPFGNV